MDKRDKIGPEGGARAPGFPLVSLAAALLAVAFWRLAPGGALGW